MRRLALIALLILAAPVTLLVSAAGADDTRAYRVELDNAFGLVPGSEVRIAGVKAGTVKEFDVNARKKAVAEIEVSGALSSLREDATCSSEPQSLIAEYFLDCQPGHAGPRLPENGLIPVHSEKYGDQTFTTVQQDLVQNTLREPFARRFSIIINSFGTALAGNPHELNAAIRRGAPALRALDEALAILAEQNRIITQLNVDSDRILARLAERRQDVVRFVQNANRTAAASAERRADLSRDFELLPGFLAELRPTLVELGRTADESTPLLADLRGASGQLNRLTTTLPAFNSATKPALEALGDAAVIGRRALRKGRDEITALKRASLNSFPVSDQLAKFVTDLDDRGRAVEPDPRSKGGRGFTGLENIVNYLYYQTLALNQYDEIGHFLHFALYEPENHCTSYNTGVDGVPARDGGMTRNAAERALCVSWTGPNQPGINQPSPYGPYHPSVCPQGSTRPDLCSPAAPREGRHAKAPYPSGRRAALSANTKTEPPPASPIGAPDAPVPPPSLADLADLGQPLLELLGLEVPRPLPQPQPRVSISPAAATDLLEFLLGD